jgi:hypothetical protein
MANLLTLFCLVDKESTLRAFSVRASARNTVDALKDLIKKKKRLGLMTSQQTS